MNSSESKPVPISVPLNASSVKMIGIKDYRTSSQGTSRTLIPDTNLNFINNQYQNNELPNQLIIDSNSDIKQISGCTFTDITTDDLSLYFIKLNTEIPFFENTFQYTSYSDTLSMPVLMEYNGQFTITRCQFINCFHHTSKDVYDDGNVFNVNANNQVDVIFNFCKFINCGNRKDMAVVCIKNSNSNISFTHCLFTFEDSTTSSMILVTLSSNVIFDSCLFNKTGPIKINCETNGTFQFTSNTITSITQEFLYIVNVASKPIISDNIFQNCNYKDGTNAFIYFSHHLEEIELIENTFSFQTMSTGKQYGGGIGAWFQNIDESETVLKYVDCNFNDNINQYTESPYSNGGAIQFGYTTLLSSTELIFSGCRFLRNQCSTGKGGALSLSVHQNVIIDGCLFQDNSAQLCGAIYIWGKTDSDSGIQHQIEMISITNCHFIGNIGGEVSGILMEEENVKISTLFIFNTKFSRTNSNLQHLIKSHCSNIEIQQVTFDESCKSLIFYICGTSHIEGCKFTACRCQILGNSNNEFDVFIENSTFEQTNSSTKGGSFLVDESSVPQTSGTYHFIGFIFNSNKAQEEGGAIAIYSDKTVLVENCTFTNNHAILKGGAIYTTSSNSATITSCIFENNLGDDEGGAINIKIGTIINCQFTNNKGNNGHAIKTEESTAIDSKLDISGCTFKNNGENKSTYMIVSYCKIITFENNKIEYLDESKTSGSIVFISPTFNYQ